MLHNIGILKDDVYYSAKSSFMSIQKNTFTSSAPLWHFKYISAAWKMWTGFGSTNEIIQYFIQNLFKTLKISIFSTDNIYAQNTPFPLQRKVY